VSDGLGLDHNEPEVTGGNPNPEGQAELSFEDDAGALRLFEPASEVTAVASLLSSYLIPPFTTLDRRQGYWQDRARQWKGLGIESELGRDKDGGAWASIGSIVRKDGYEGFGTLTDGMSIFDPVVCEVAYHWFCPTEGVVFDPFAGGSVRGIVSGAGGRPYFGVDLSGSQVEANRAQARRIFDGSARGVAPGKPPPQAPTWIEGDSRRIIPELRDMEIEPDLIFTCPPYGDLEVYSDDPADLSNMPAAEFDAAYCEIIKDAVGLLRPNSFAAIVVGNYRDKRGCLRDLVGLTVQAFEAAGAAYYNEAIVLDPIGTAAVRARRQFAAQRKLVRVHQQMLVFCKGNPKTATDGIRADDEILEAEAA
jgi:hypothetical protein